MSRTASLVPEPVYHRPSTIAEAADLLAHHGGGARLLAGGQTLIPEIDRPDNSIAAIIDLGSIADLGEIRWYDSHIEIGAMVTIAEARRQLAVAFPIIEPCLGRVGNSAVRNRATIGGSVALADTASEITTFLLAYDATLLLAGGDDAALPVTAMLGADRPANLFLRAIRLPLPSPGEGAGFAEILRRRSGGRSLAMGLVRSLEAHAILVFSGGDRHPVRLEKRDIAALPASIDPHIADLAPPVRAWIAAAVHRAIADVGEQIC
jgi:carbon-monoxide dehydrogenase medium subunit